MSKALRLFEPGPGLLCSGCPWFEVCGAAESEEACKPIWGPESVGGQHVLHPALPWTADYMRSIQGPDFRSVSAYPVDLPRLPKYLPQIRVRSALCGFLDGPAYGIRARDVIGRRRRVLTASDLREHVGLAQNQKLILMLFDQDEILERLWNEGARLIPQIAAAGYDLVASPSFSTWMPRPRVETLYNLKRSLIVFRALQMTGAPAVVRVGWTVGQDVRRFAEWIKSNEAVKLIALDWMTYRSAMDWRKQLDGLSLLDRLTKRRLEYLINGPTTLDRCTEIYANVPQRRVCITNATAAAPPIGQGQLPLDRGQQRGAAFQERCDIQSDLLERAEQLARSIRARRRLLSEVAA